MNDPDVKSDDGTQQQEGANATPRPPLPKGRGARRCKVADAHRRCRRRWRRLKPAERLQSRIALGILLVTIAYTVAAIFQWRVTARTVDLMEEQALDARRPNVVLERLIPPPAIVASQPLPFVAALRNAGKGMARNVTISLSYTDCLLGGDGQPLPSPTPLPTIPPEKRGRPHVRVGRMSVVVDEADSYVPALDAGAQLEIPFALHAVHPDLLDAMTQGGQAICVSVRAAFTDAVGAAQPVGHACVAYRVGRNGRPLAAACP